MPDTQQCLIYQSEDGSTRIDVTLGVEALWLNQRLFTAMRMSSKSPGGSSP